MSMSPIVLAFYDENDEKVKEFSQRYIPWKILKEAVKMQKLDPNNLTEEDIDRVSNLVVTAFGNRFTKEELESFTSAEDVITVIQSIVTCVGGGLKNVMGPD